ncbi:MAG: HNH endonuclease [Ktedonobacteraceae bacterium]
MMYILITTNKGQIIRLSPDDIDLSEVTWCLDNSRGKYPIGRYNGPIVKLHRIVAERMIGKPIPKDMVVDHIDGDPLNCHRDNLRIATPRQNMQNRKHHQNSKHAYKGIMVNGSGHHWFARIMHHGKYQLFGPYDTPLEAAKMYDIKAKEYFGEYARINGV